MLWIPCALALLQSAAPTAPSTPRDPRLERLVTLDGEHPIRFEGALDEWQLRRAKLRRQILVAAGLWPLESERAPVEALVTGTIEREAYRVQRVLFESWPGFFVSGNLYLPQGARTPGPAVLSPHGHWGGGRLTRRSDEEVRAELASGAESDEAAARFHLQARCAQLARLGCVVFHYDMIGYGDSHQLGHNDSFLDAEAVQYGMSAFGFQTWNSLRALDFLAALPEVDPTRIGVTGASGGGTQTFVLCALDERPAAAFPAVMVSSEMQGGCECENAPFLRIDTNNVELCSLFAPRPLEMSAANDWTLHLEERGLPLMRHVWGLWSATERVRVRTWPEFGHNYNQHAREEMLRFFDRELGLGAPEPLREAAFVPIEPGELSVFAEGAALPASARDASGIRAGMRARIEARLSALAPREPADLEPFRRVVGGALQALVDSGSEGWTTPEATPETTPEAGLESAPRGAREELAFDPGDGRAAVPLVILRPERPTGDVCVVVSGAGRAGLADGASARAAGLLKLYSRGVTCVLPELLAAGSRSEPAPRLRVDAQRHANYVGYTWGYNRPLVSERVRDVLVALEYARRLRARPGAPATGRLLLWGEGQAGPWALMAAALAPSVVDRTLADWTRDPAAVDDFAQPDFFPGALGYGGLPAFSGLLAPRALELCACAQLPSLTQQCYQAAGASAALNATSAASSERIAWLLGEPPAAEPEGARSDR